MRWTVLLALVAAASASSGRRAKKRQSSSDDPGATPSDVIYVSYPACGSFRCSVSWPQGLNTYVNWLNPPVGGDVSVTLNSNTNGTNYVVADRVPSISQAGYCDAGAGVGTVIPGKTCGRVEFIVPSFWQPGNYSIAVTSLQNTSIAGFTDFVVVSAPNSTELSSAAASASSANGGATNVVLETISAPTSTDSADRTSYTGPSTPAPTAGSDASSSSAPASSSARDSSSSSAAAGSSSSSGVQSSSSSATQASTSSSSSPSSSASTSPANTLMTSSSFLLASFAPLLALVL